MITFDLYINLKKSFINVFNYIIKILKLFANIFINIIVIDNIIITIDLCLKLLRAYFTFLIKLTFL